MVWYNADVFMKKKIKKVIITKKDTAAKMIAPKVATAFTNLIRMGPRIVLRSTVELLKANLITRIIGCLSLLLIDLIDLFRKRISRVQFVKNILLSALLVLSGALGWELGTRWLSVELAAIVAVEVVVGLIGAGLLSFGTNWIACKVADKYVKSDADQMWEILDPIIIELPENEQEFIRENITLSCLKKMYASEDKEVFGLELIEKIRNNEKIEGVLKPPHHKVAQRS